MIARKKPLKSRTQLSRSPINRKKTSLNSINSKYSLKKQQRSLKRSPLRAKLKSLTDQEREAYHQATEAARHPEGYLVCQRCGHSILEGQEQRHHIVFRSQSGATTSDNLMIVCVLCHDHLHHKKV